MISICMLKINKKFRNYSGLIIPLNYICLTKLNFKMRHILLAITLLIGLHSEILQYDSLIEGTEFLVIFRPSDGKKYKLRTGLGCLRALLDPPENINLMLKGFGDFEQGMIDRYRPMLFIQTPYHKAFCEIISIDMIK